MKQVSGYQPSISRKLFFLARIWAACGRTSAAMPARCRASSSSCPITRASPTSPPCPLLSRATPAFRRQEGARQGDSLRVHRRSDWGGHGLISRTGNYREGQQELSRFAGLTAQGICPVIFPEGTRSRTGRVRDFYAGGVRIILETAHMPVLSVAVDGGSGYRQCRSC